FGCHSPGLRSAAGESAARLWLPCAARRRPPDAGLYLCPQEVLAPRARESSLVALLHLQFARPGTAQLHRRAAAGERASGAEGGAPSQHPTTIHAYLSLATCPAPIPHRTPAARSGDGKTPAKAARHLHHRQFVLRDRYSGLHPLSPAGG